MGGCVKRCIDLIGVIMEPKSKVLCFAKPDSVKKWALFSEVDKNIKQFLTPIVVIN